MLSSSSVENSALRKYHRKWPLILLGLLLIATQGCGFMTVYGKQEGVVLDKESKTPLEGAGVVAEYSYTYSTVGGPHSIPVSARETVTGPDGRFKIPTTLVGGSCCLFSWFEPYPTFYVFKPEHGGDRFSPGDTIRDFSDGYDKRYILYKNENGYVLLLRKEEKIGYPEPLILGDKSNWQNYIKMIDEYIKKREGKRLDN